MWLCSGGTGVLTLTPTQILPLHIHELFTVISIWLFCLFFLKVAVLKASFSLFIPCSPQYRGRQNPIPHWLYPLQEVGPLSRPHILLRFLSSLLLSFTHPSLPKPHLPYSHFSLLPCTEHVKLNPAVCTPTTPPHTATCLAADRPKGNTLYFYPI